MADAVEFGAPVVVDIDTFFILISGFLVLDPSQLSCLAMIKMLQFTAVSCPAP